MPRLSSILPLPQFSELLTRIGKAGIVTSEQFLVNSIEHYASRYSIDPSVLQEALLATSYAHAAPLIPGDYLSEQETATFKSNSYFLSTGSEALDALLSCLPVGHITEVIAPAGCCKSQLCFFAAASLISFFPVEEQEGPQPPLPSVLYISSMEHIFDTSRFVDLVQTRIEHGLVQQYPLQPEHDPTEYTQALSEKQRERFDLATNLRFRHQSLDDSQALIDELEKLQQALDAYSDPFLMTTRLIIIDSFSALVYPALAKKKSIGHVVMNRAAILMKSMAMKHNIAFLITCEGKMTENGVANGSGDQQNSILSKYRVRNVLGEFWKSESSQQLTIYPHYSATKAKEVEASITAPLFTAQLTKGFWKPSGDSIVFTLKDQAIVSVLEEHAP